MQPELSVLRQVRQQKFNPKWISRLLIQIHCKMCLLHHELKLRVHQEMQPQLNSTRRLE